MASGGEDMMRPAAEGRSPGGSGTVDLIQFAKPELQPGERLLWAAQSRLNPAKVARVHLTATCILTSAPCFERVADGRRIEGLIRRTLIEPGLPPES